MTLYVRYTIILVACATLSCATFGPPVAPLSRTLGFERIARITADVLNRHLRGRSRLEPEIIVEPSFWRPVRDEIGATVGPEEGAAVFLEVGFGRFLQSFEAHLMQRAPGAKELVFDGDAVMEFILFPRPRGCQGSPCDVPPCCGDGFRCWRCKPPPLIVKGAA